MFANKIETHAVNRTHSTHIAFKRAQGACFGVCVIVSAVIDCEINKFKPIHNPRNPQSKDRNRKISSKLI